MKILVIDDSEDQLETAKQMLSDKQLLTASTFAEARAMLTSETNFDVVLTDLMMPGEEKGQSLPDFIGSPCPYGFAIALLALKVGVPKVAIVSNGNDDGNHHLHPILWACDSLEGVILPGRLMAFVGRNCPTKHFMIKDWATVLQKLLE